jgi:hypothetical protein
MEAAFSLTSNCKFGAGTLFAFGQCDKCDKEFAKTLIRNIFHD